MDFDRNSDFSFERIVFPHVSAALIDHCRFVFVIECTRSEILLLAQNERQCQPFSVLASIQSSPNEKFVHGKFAKWIPPKNLHTYTLQFKWRNVNWSAIGHPQLTSTIVEQRAHIQHTHTAWPNRLLMVWVKPFFFAKRSQEQTIENFQGKYFTS